MIEEIIAKIPQVFIEFYNQKYCQNTSYKEDANMLGNGYCFYLAYFLKEQFPEGNILTATSDHYIFEYNGHFFDFFVRILATDTFSEFNTGIYIPKTDLRICDEEDYLMAEITTMNNLKSTVWKAIEPELIAFILTEKEKMLSR